MTTLVRLMKLVRRLNLSPRRTLPRGNTLKNVAFQRLLHSEALFLTKQKHEYTTDAQAQADQEVSEEHRMINLFQQEIQKYGKLSKFDIDKLLEDVKESGVVSSMQGHFLIQCCSVASNKSALSRRVLADEIMNMLKEFGTQLDVSHYNALLNVYAETDYQYSPIEFLETMVNAGIKPNRVTYQKLIAQYCNEGQVSEASELLNRANSEGIPINEDMLSSILYGYFVNNNDVAGFEILKDMENLGITPGIKTYSGLLYVYASRGEIDNIRKTLKECEEKSIWVPDKVLLMIVHNLSLNNFTEHVDEILALTHKSNVYLKDATKFICKLIDKHHYETAYKIYQTLPENRTIINGNTFLQALINSNAPVEKTMEYCKTMENEKLNPKAFVIAIQKTIAKDMYTSSISLMKGWKNLGGEIRAHYFSPILKAHGEAGQVEEIKNVLKTMILEFGLQPSVHMLKTCILPYIQCPQEEMLPILLDYQIDSVRVCNAVLLYLLEKNEIREAVRLMSNFSTIYKADVVKSELLDALKNTEDVPSFVWILHYLYSNEINFHNRSSDIDNTKCARDFVDSYVLEVVDIILSKNEVSNPRTTNKKYLLVALFRNLIDKGINLSPKVVDEIETKLISVMTPEIKQALNTLKVEELILKPIQKELQSMTWKKKLTNIEQLESLAKLFSVTNKNESIIMKKKLLWYYCNTLNENKMTELLLELEVNRVELTPSYYAAVIDTFLRLQKPEEAEICMLKANCVIKDFRMSKIIVLKLATAIAESGHFQRALDCLNQPTIASSQPMTMTCKKFLSAVLKFDDENYLFQAFDVLKEKGYFNGLKNRLAIPLIQLYLNRGDNAVTLEKFEWVYNAYNLAPCQAQLMKAFIEDGDEKSLNRVIAISEKVRGSLVCYFNLALAYLESSRFDEAKEVINKHVSSIPEELVYSIAQNYYETERIDELEKLFNLLNSLNYDVERLCVILIRAFGHYNEYDKGYRLYMKMEEENIKPSNTFINYLGLIVNIKNNDISVLKRFTEAFEGRDEMKARQLLEEMPLLYKRECYSKMCKGYAHDGNFSEVIELIRELRYRYNATLHPLDAEFILNSMVKHKDVASMERIGMYMDRDFKKQIRYNYYLNHLYLVSGAWNLYLKNIEKRLLEGTLDWKDIHMHVKTAVIILLRHPELLDQYESIAYMCNEKNIPGLVHALWIYYFIMGDVKAETLWAQYIKNSEISTWTDVRFLKQARTPETSVRIAELVQESGLKQSTKLALFTFLIERCLKSDHQRKYNYAVQCLLHATKVLPMESFNIDLLVDVQTGLEYSGDQWPWSKRFDKVDRQKVKRIVDAIMHI